MNILLIGIDYFAFKGSGDKNFWYCHLPLIAKHYKNVFIISFNYRERLQESQVENIHIINKRPFHLGFDIKRDSAQLNNKYKCHSHFQKQPFSLIERTISILVNIFLLKKLKKRWEIKSIHFMDNFGPVMGVVSWAIPKVSVFCSAISYMARGAFQDKYLLYSFKNITKVIPYSDAYAKKIFKIGIPRKKIKTIHWGIPFNTQNDTNFDRIKRKNGIKMREDTACILWTGFIQQINEDSLKFSVDIAHKILKMRISNVRFVFTLKPECFKKEYLSFEKENIQIKVTDQNEFNGLLDKTSILLSPVVNMDSIVAPPLTWIECMALEIPVFTTNAPGINEIIIHKENGYASSSSEELVSGILESIESKSYQKLGENARTYVAEYYNIEKIAKQYIALWSEDESKL